MATLHDIVAVEAEFTALLNNPRRPLSRFIEVSLEYGRMMAEQDPRGALEALSLAIETLHDPPAPAEVEVALGLLRTMRAVSSQLGITTHELDAITREQHILDAELVAADPGQREALSRRAAAVRFDIGDVDAGFRELIEGLRSCEELALDDLASDMLLAIRRIPITEALIADIEALWVFLRRHRRGGAWELWCLVALGAVRLKVGDAITAKMYLRRAEATLGGATAPVVAALVNGWVALASGENSRARISFAYAARVDTTDTRVRLLTAAGLGEALLALGRVDEARKPLSEAIGYDVGDPNTVARCHELLSQIAADDGRFQDAYEHLLFARLLERPSVQPAAGARRRRETVVDLRDDVGEAPLPAEPPLRTVSAQIAEQAIVSEVAEVALRADPPTVIAEMDLQRVDGAAAAHRGADAGTVTDADVDADTDTADDDVANAPGVANGDPVDRPLGIDRLELVFEPIVENSSGLIGAAAVSLRLIRADGYVADALALALASHAELRRQVTRHTLRRVCRVLSAWDKVSLLVDVSHCELDAQLVDLVTEELAAADVDPGRLVIVLSGAGLARSAENVEILNALRELGVGVGVSGLGSSFTSSDVLLSCPVDVVTVDGDVFELARSGGPQRRVIDAAASLARGFGFELVATGVADAAHFDLQVQFGCHGVQGPFVGEAMSESEFARRVTTASRELADDLDDLDASADD
ncbi:MAG: EAL domain-containing protein [Actinobacteria bacterium]|nr:EAL domain-containing protein [Actinomycetota bacterium]